MEMKINCFYSVILLASSLTIWGQEKPQPTDVSSSGPDSSIIKEVLAVTPPMGWNSWDGYGTTINEGEFKANADWFAKHLKPSGWSYVTIDMEWFVTNPIAEGNSKTFQYSMDKHGRYM